MQTPMPTPMTTTPSLTDKLRTLVAELNSTLEDWHYEYDQKDPRQRFNLIEPTSTDEGETDPMVTIPDLTEEGRSNAYQYIRVGSMLGAAGFGGYSYEIWDHCELTSPLDAPISAQMAPGGMLIVIDTRSYNEKQGQGPIE